MKDLSIYIPTVGRVGKQPVADLLKAAGAPFQLVTPRNEVRLHVHAGYAVLPCSAKGIRATRQWILDRHAGGKVLILDDDLTFWARNAGGDRFSRFEHPDETRRLLKKISLYLDDHAHGGIVEKFMSQSRPRNVVHGGRYFQVLAYNLSLFPNPMPKYRVEVGEDMDMNLQLLKAGKQSFILTEFTKTDREWAPGGCLLMGRNEKTLLQESQKLARLHPGIVTLKETLKEGSHNWLKISWRNAQKEGGLL